MLMMFGFYIVVDGPKIFVFLCFKIKDIICILVIYEFKLAVWLRY